MPELCGKGPQEVIKYLPELRTADTCPDTYDGYEELAQKRGLILLKVVSENRLRFVDPDTGGVYLQNKADFLNRRFPDASWTKDLVEHYLALNNIKHRGVLRDCDGEWVYVKGGKLRNFEDLLSADVPGTSPQHLPYYNDTNIHTFAEVHGMLYLIKLRHAETGEEFVKVGITRNNVGARAPGSSDGYVPIKVVELPMFMPEAYALEQQVIAKFKTFQYWPQTRFSGWTECFYPQYGAEIAAFVTENSTITYEFEGLF